MFHRTRVFAPLVVLALLTACASTGRQNADEDQAHPLAGQIWDVRSGVFVDYATMLADANRVRQVLIGEIHINPEHHRIQARIIGDLADPGRPMSLVFEIFEQDQQAALTRAAADPGATTETIAQATGIRDSGWNWDSYEPLVGLALQEGLAIRAGNAPRAQVNEIAKNGPGVIPEDRLTALGMSTPLPSSAEAALTETIVDSHCGHVFGDMTGRLIAAQRLRDATMADVMLASRPDVSVLITGSGHARRDYGVPYYVLARDPSVAVLSIGLTETRDGIENPVDYVDQLEGLDVPFDYLWFTGRTVWEDPCEQFKESLEQLRRHGEGVPADSPVGP